MTFTVRQGVRLLSGLDSFQIAEAEFRLQGGKDRPFKLLAVLVKPKCSSPNLVGIGAKFGNVFNG
ncbi:hypothetical protein ACQKGC_05225 [Allorhizobium pseudoryzae]|uniref:hypothetical protein n=1 Tax=Allorhizobium pseudoryzae TaxID=379684 RepID=UPI003D051821